MNANERQALRDKHHRDQYGLCAGCGSRTLDGGTSTIEWKFCDVIKLMDDFGREIMNIASWIHNDIMQSATVLDLIDVPESLRMIFEQYSLIESMEGKALTFGRHEEL